MSIAKNVLPVVAGAMGAMMLITLGETGIHKMYPLPPGTDIHNKEALSSAIALMPAMAFVLLLVNYVVCSFAGGVISAVVSGRTTKTPSMIVGGLLTLAGVFNLIAVHHPLWFSLINVLVYFPCAYLGYHLLKKEPKSV